jgi:glycosyltransferase involved in cell wall biosynthesis
LKKIFKKPFLLSAPTFGSKQPEWPKIIKLILYFLEKFALKVADFVFLFSEGDIKYVKSRFKIYCVEFLGNGVDVDKFENASSMHFKEAPLERKIIMFVGRLTKSKGLNYLIRAFSKLIEYVDVELVLVGDGPEKACLLRLIKEEKVEDRVVFLGTRRDVEKILKLADVFVLPSIYEGFPVSLLEAMAARRPIVATRVGAIPSVIKDGVNGLLIDPGDVQQLFEKLLLLLKLNPELGDIISMNAFLTVKERYSWKVIAEKVYGRYEKILRAFSQYF